MYELGDSFRFSGFCSNYTLLKSNPQLILNWTASPVHLEQEYAPVVRCIPELDFRRYVQNARNHWGLHSCTSGVLQFSIQLAQLNLGQHFFGVQRKVGIQ